ncbi:MAG: hypothetical protein JXR48_15010 [Candidatus Delongbacteria bacterium]|nr:hypothetical protein [Candidatus Delongbacteria bacterium]MBN2836266.1 hypothetical protein [Candidatus Delongbacteria bacterium]
MRYLLILMITFNLHADFVLPHLQKTPILDGILSDTETESMVKIDDFFEISDVSNPPAKERTEFYAGYTENNLYFIAKCYKDGSVITSNHGARDGITNSDRVLVYLDTYNSRDKAYYISANVFGEQGDGIIDNGSVINTVDLKYKSVTKCEDDFYLIEFELPLKSITYRSGENLTWNIFSKRVIVDSGKELSFCKVNRDNSNYFDNYSSFKINRLNEFSNLTISPGIVGSEQENRYDYDTELNVIYKPVSNITISATINPDFSAIESDGLNFNINSKTPVFFSEKRPFFLEKENYWSSSIDIYNTRSVFDPSFGLKVSGKFEDESFYLMTALDQDVDMGRFYSDLDGKKEDNLFLFSNYKRNLTDRTWLRGAVASRMNEDYQSYNFSFEGRSELNRSTVFKTQYVYSLYEKSDHSYKRDAAFYTIISRSTQNFDTYFSFRSVGDGFENDMGYYEETDINLFSGKVQFSRRDDAFLLPDYSEIGLTNSTKYNYEFDRFLETESELYYGVEYDDMFSIWSGSNLAKIYNFGFYNDRFLQWFSLNYNKFTNVSPSLNVTVGNNLWYYELDENGKPIIENYTKIGPYLSIRLFDHVELGTGYTYRELDNLYNEDSYSLSCKIQFDKSLWLKINYDVSQAEYDIWDFKKTSKILNPILTYKPDADKSFYIGFNYSFDEEDCLKEYDSRFFMKYTHSFDAL